MVLWHPTCQYQYTGQIYCPPPLSHLEESGGQQLKTQNNFALITTKSLDFLFSSLKWVENQPNFSYFTQSWQILPQPFWLNLGIIAVPARENSGKKTASGGERNKICGQNIDGCRFQNPLTESKRKSQSVDKI